MARTGSGFEWEIAPEAKDDMELLELLIEMDRGASTPLPEVARRLLGEDGKKALYDALRNDAGRVPISAARRALVELLTSDADAKK